MRQENLTPLAAHKESPNSSTAYVFDAWTNPNVVVDDKGNTALHVCRSPMVMTFLLEQPLTDVNTTNKVRPYAHAMPLLSLLMKSPCCFKSHSLT